MCMVAGRRARPVFAEDAITGDGAKPGAKKPKKGPLISSGRVAKATKRKGASKAGQSRTAQKATKKKR